MIHEHISEVSMKTYDALSVYLVGGFDAEKNHRRCLQIFTGTARKALMHTCLQAENGNPKYLADVQTLIKILLAQADEMIFNGYKYTFAVQSFDCKCAIDMLVQDVLAQVNEE